MTMIQFIRESRISKSIALLLAVIMLEPITGFNSLKAGSGGPTQPEYSSFTTVGASNLVDPFTGNVGYSVPLFEIGGYPVSMSYNGDISPEQDAGWVGLGWGLNVGSITRGLRGVPDDFDGDKVEVFEKKKPHVQITAKLSTLASDKTIELNVVSKSSVGKSTTLIYDNYSGIGFGFGRSGSQSQTTSGNPASSDSTAAGYEFAQKAAAKLGGFEKTAGVSMDMEYNTKSGFTMQSELSNNALLKLGKFFLGGSASAQVNSRNGQIGLGLSTGMSQSNISKNSYGFNFAYNPVMQAPLAQILTMNVDISTSFSMSGGLTNKRTVSLAANVNVEKIKSEYAVHPAYGLIHDMNSGVNYGGNDKLEIHDEEELPKYIDRKTRQLTSGSVNYDVFNISGAGIGGSFRIHPRYVTMHGPSIYNKPVAVNGLHGKVEVGIGSGFELGVNLGFNLKKEKYEPLNKDDFKDGFHFGRLFSEIGNSWKPWTFRNDFEFIPNQQNYIDGISSNSLMNISVLEKLRLKIPNKFKSSFDVIKNKSQYSEDVNAVSSTIKKDGRDAQQQVVTYMTASEATTHSFMKHLESYSINSGTPAVSQVNGEYQLEKASIDRISGDKRKGHHISEFTVTQPDGSRYYYGTPVYNYEQYDYCFNVSTSEDKNGTSGNAYDYLKGTVQYQFPNQNPSQQTGNDLIYNKRGIDQSCQKKITPSYAHAFLLNAVLSSDYVDKTNDGPSEDDLGNYVKFNYWLAQGNGSPTGDGNGFRWRNLVGSNTADLNTGVKADKMDDKGSFTYGSKELWYLQSIETKDQVAVFYLLPRADGGEVLEHGSIGGSKYQQFINKIAIFNKSEFKQYGLSAEPVKVIHLEYSYDLCQGYSLNAPAVSTQFVHPITGSANDYNRGGKLTLHKVWFTYGKQNIPMSAPYIFEYKGYNPNYQYKSVDRWGIYRPLVNATGTNSMQTLNSQEFSYTNQNKTLTDDYASAWMLTDITLPSGGKIKIEYESDDYAYVQDKAAMQMIKIDGLSDSREAKMGDDHTNLYLNIDKTFSPIVCEQRFLTFQKPAGVSNVSDLFNKNEMLYYNFMVMMARPGVSGSEETYEPVNGFCEIKDIGESLTSGYGFIELKPERTGLWYFNPISRNAIQQGMARTPWVFYPQSDNVRNDQINGFNKVISTLLGFIPESIAMTTGKANYFRMRNFARKVDLSRSFIRINHPTKFKLGGGHRVKAVTINDNWHSMSGSENDASYKILYKYTTADGKMSSGVASNEPSIGGDENPLKYPMDIYTKRTLTKKVKLARKKKYKKELNGIGPITISMDLGPVCEEFFPPPVVGYSRVEIRTEYPAKDQSTNFDFYQRHKTGYTVQEFFTAKDYPTYSESTILEKRQLRINGPGFGRKWSKEKQVQDEDGNTKSSKKTSVGVDIATDLTYSTASQGFVVEMNDMHGKPKSNLVYAENGSTAPFSGSAYFYKSDANGKLINSIDVVQSNGVCEKQEMGLDIEPILYGSNLTSTQHSIRPNTDFDYQTPSAVSLGIMLGYSLTRSTSKVVTMTKLVRRTGIVDSVIVYDKGAVTSTKNLAWDGLTGQVLVTSVKNEYGDMHYSLTKPAHWMHSGIAGAYENIDYECSLTVTNGVASVSNSVLYPGDELIPIEATFSPPASFTKRLWVLDRTANSVSLVEDIGISPPDGNYKVRVVRSGHRNILGAGAETVMLTKYPFKTVSNTKYLYIDPNTVISGKGITFDDKRMVFHGFKFCFDEGCVSESTEPNGIPTPTIAHFFPCSESSSHPNGRNVFGGKGVLDNMSAVVNPFTSGIWGVWKPFGDYSYHDKRNQYAIRTQSEASGGYNANYTNTRTDGLLKNYKEFWNWTGSQWLPRTKPDTANPWVWTETLQQTDEKGNHVQTVNALNIYSSALYGYNDRRLVTATATNAEVREILFDGFEDISTQSGIRWLCNGGQVENGGQLTNEYTRDFIKSVRHWPIAAALIGTTNEITDEESHTGWKSLKLQAGTTEVPLIDAPTTNYSNGTGLQTSYWLQTSDFIDRFKPMPDSTYLLSFWIKSPGTSIITSSNFAIQLTESYGTSPITLTPEGQATDIDGWVKLSYRFTPQSSKITFKFINNGNSNLASDKQQVYLDDIRVQPINSSMQAYVYDYNKLRLMSTLDDNNFAVFFEYDEEGSLVRKKVETARGVMTVDENRNSMKK